MAGLSIKRVTATPAPVQGTFHVQAVSVADPTLSGQAVAVVLDSSSGTGTIGVN